MPAKVARDPCASDASNLGRDLLDRDHQRKTQDKRPGQAIPKLRANLTMRPDAAGIIVCRACYQARPEPSEKTPQAAGVSTVSGAWSVGCG